MKNVHEDDAAHVLNQIDRADLSVVDDRHIGHEEQNGVGKEAAATVDELFHVQTTKNSNEQLEQKLAQEQEHCIRKIVHHCQAHLVSGQVDHCRINPFMCYHCVRYNSNGNESTQHKYE